MKFIKLIKASNQDPYKIADNILDQVEQIIRMYLDVELQYDIDEDDRTIIFWHHPEDVIEGSISLQDRKDIIEAIKQSIKTQNCKLVSIDIKRKQVEFTVEY